MAIKKSELYSSLWASCDLLRGGMDASQYKDYVLVLLFIKYVSDKYAGQPYAPIKIPPGASFKDMVALKGKPTIGDDINKKIIAPLADANKLSDLPDFNDAGKLGSGKEMVAFALKRHKRATLVGQRTAGAVLAGAPLFLSNGDLLYLAVMDVEVEGVRLEGTGVDVDVEVPDVLPYAEGKDPQLDKALDVAASAVGRR